MRNDSMALKPLPDQIVHMQWRMRTFETRAWGHAPLGLQSQSHRPKSGVRGQNTSRVDSYERSCLDGIGVRVFVNSQPRPCVLPARKSLARVLALIKAAESDSLEQVADRPQVHDGTVSRQPSACVICNGENGLGSGNQLDERTGGHFAVRQALHITLKLPSSPPCPFDTRASTARPSGDVSYPASHTLAQRCPPLVP